MDGIEPDIKPEIEELSPPHGPTLVTILDENGEDCHLAKSNNNTIKTLSVQQVKTLQHQSQISTSSGGGTVYVNVPSGVGGSLTTNPGQPTPVSSVRTPSIVTSASTGAVTRQQLETIVKSGGINLVHVTVPQSVIQSPSVIQSASGQLLSKGGNVILLSGPKGGPPGVIQATSGALQTVQLLEAQQRQLNSDESLSNDGVDLPHRTGVVSGPAGTAKRREILTRRPSYRKILNDLGGAEITGERGDSTATTSESSQDGLDDDHGIIIGGQYPSSVVKVLNANALGLSGTVSDGGGSLQTITMTNAGTGGTIVQYAHPDGQPFYVPGNHWAGSPVSGDLQAYTIRPMTSSQAGNTPTVVVHGSSSSHQHGHPPEEQTRKREIRLLKNREAARECRRKKKEYIKCLENRVAVLENQNKALIDELKSLKELYCQQKVE